MSSVHSGGYMMSGSRNYLLLMNDYAEVTRNEVEPSRSTAVNNHQLEAMLVDAGVPHNVVAAMNADKSSYEVVRSVLNFALDCASRDRLQRSIIVDAKLERENLLDSLGTFNSSSPSKYWLESLLEEKEVAATRTSQLTKQVEALTEQLARLKQENVNLESQLRSLRIEKDDAARQVSSLRNKLANQHSELFQEISRRVRLSMLFEQEEGKRSQNENYFLRAVPSGNGSHAKRVTFQLDQTVPNEQSTVIRRVKHHSANRPLKSILPSRETTGNNVALSGFKQQLAFAVSPYNHAYYQQSVSGNHPSTRIVKANSRDTAYAITDFRGKYLAPSKQVGYYYSSDDSSGSPKRATSAMTVF